MGGTAQDFRIDYVEFSTDDIQRTRDFYEGVFGWEFTDWGPDYVSFGDGRLNGGFSRDKRGTGGGPLVVVYATDLAAAESAVIAHGGVIVKETFSFPGGRRFHFSDPGGNVLAVWSDRAG